MNRSIHFIDSKMYRLTWPGAKLSQVNVFAPIGVQRRKPQTHVFTRAFESLGTANCKLVRRRVCLYNSVYNDLFICFCILNINMSVCVLLVHGWVCVYLHI